MTRIIPALHSPYRPRLGEDRNLRSLPMRMRTTITVRNTSSGGGPHNSPPLLPLHLPPPRPTLQNLPLAPQHPLCGLERLSTPLSNVSTNQFRRNRAKPMWTLFFR
uniref:Uncharacterized protein n=1 Tax=Cacopsylla melanoneura TaxID=428564 RepID=A0A8D9EEC2_9HEMI